MREVPVPRKTDTVCVSVVEEQQVKEREEGAFLIDIEVKLEEKDEWTR